MPTEHSFIDIYSTLLHVLFLLCIVELRLSTLNKPISDLIWQCLGHVKVGLWLIGWRCNGGTCGLHGIERCEHWIGCSSRLTNLTKTVINNVDEALLMSLTRHVLQTSRRTTGNSDRNVSVRPSVRPTVTRWNCVKTKKARGMISSSSGSPKTLVFWRQISSPNSKGSSNN